MKNRVYAAATAVLMLVCVVLLLLALPVHQSRAVTPTSNLSYVGGIYNSQSYATWGGEIITGNTATGSQTILICASGVLLDGRVFNPLATTNSIFALYTVDPQGSLSETITPTAISAVATVSVPTAPQNQFCANVTASFTNVHGSSMAPNQVLSGDQGIQEAVIDASLNGGGNVYYQADTGILTLATGAVTTTSTAFVPTASYVGGASCRVTTTITTAANYSLGIAGATTAYVNTSTLLTAGNVQQITFLPAAGTKLGTTTVPSAALSALITTTNANPGAGALHCRAWGNIPVQSAF